MASSGTSAVRIIDSDNEVVQVTSNALDVNIAGGTAVDLGDVEIRGHNVLATVAVNVTDSAVQLSSVPCKHVDIMAATANTGIIYVGATGVTAATGIALYAGDVYSVDIENLNLIYVLASVDTEDVQWVVYN